MGSRWGDAGVTDMMAELGVLFVDNTTLNDCGSLRSTGVFTRSGSIALIHTTAYLSILSSEFRHLEGIVHIHRPFVRKTNERAEYR